MIKLRSRSVRESLAWIARSQLALSKPQSTGNEAVTNIGEISPILVEQAQTLAMLAKITRYMLL